jgi:hypothetical protein
MELQRPKNLMDRLKISIGRRFEGLGLREFALLCDSHKLMNPYVIRAVFNVLAAEVTLKSDRLRHYLEDRDKATSDGKRIQDAIERLDAVNALWVAEGSWKMLFPGRNLPEGYRRVTSQCEACILASVGARATLLSDLRANMISRVRSDGAVPRLWRVVEGWIDWFVEEDAKEIRAESDELGQLMRRRRKEIYKQQRKRERRRRPMEMGARGDDYESRPTSSASSRKRRPDSVRLSSRDGPTRNKEGTEEEKREPSIERERVRSERESQMWRDYEREILGHHDPDDECDDERKQPVEDGIQSWYARSQIALSEAGGMHPAFQTDYSHESAVVSPLSTSPNQSNSKCKHSTTAAATSSRRGHDGIPEEDDRSWVSVTVHSADSGKAMEPNSKTTTPGVPHGSSRYAKLNGRSTSSVKYTSHTTTFPSRTTPTTAVPTLVQNPALDNLPKVDPVTGRVLSGKFHSLPDGSHIPLYASSSVYPSEANQVPDREAKSGYYEDNDNYRPNMPRPRDYSFRVEDDDDDGDTVVGMKGKFRDPFAEDRKKRER